jgi:hypothetical protein
MFMDDRINVLLEELNEYENQVLFKRFETKEYVYLNGPQLPTDSVIFGRAII